MKKVSTAIMLVALSMIFGVAVVRGSSSSTPCTATTTGTCSFPTGSSISWTVTQMNPGPTMVTITVSRPSPGNVLHVEAHTSFIHPDACTLSLGGTFNVQVKLRPNTYSTSLATYIVMQTTDASNGQFGGQPDYMTVSDSGRHTGPETPLSTIGITATYSKGNCLGTGTSSAIPPAADVNYYIPVGTSTGQYNAVSFLGTQPFGYNFEPPNGITMTMS